MANSSIFKYRLPVAAAAALCLGAMPASAGTTTGSIGIALTVTNACVVNEAASVQANAGSLGDVLFPDQPGIFGDVDGELVGSLGTLKILCSPGISPALTIGSGSNDSAGKRHLASNGQNVAYRLFSDAARLSEIGIGQQINLGTATTDPFSVPIYARVNSGGSVVPAGTYTDTVLVTLSW